ncbi:Zinc finger protein 182 [Araneus ventricosus]|uniref:Zinc finger protein 182 n=1 Tax=Araneus ventricosus TaxID=182803 RepID=A0A4Y2CAE7_ARAVE|nr:Zinc finger protein 182 [Araneus ventricosus]
MDGKMCPFCGIFSPSNEECYCFLDEEEDDECFVPHFDGSNDITHKIMNTDYNPVDFSTEDLGNASMDSQQSNGQDFQKISLLGIENEEMNSLLTENDKQIPFTPASKRKRKYSLFAGNSTNAQHEHSLDTSILGSTFRVREREVKMKENAFFKASSETFEPATNSESEVREIYKRKPSPTRDDHQQNNCRSNVSTFCHSVSSEKWETLPDETNWRSLNSGREIFSDSMECITQKPLLDSKCSFNASTSLLNTSFSMRIKEKDKSAFDVSRDLTGRRSSSNAALIVPSRIGDEDATVKQHLEFMKDADSAAGPSTFSPESIRPGEKKPHACIFCPKKFNQKNDLVRHHRTHTGEKPYGCDICGKEFTQKGNLGTHYRTHKGEKHFVCDICIKGFVRKDDLDIHYRTHTGEKPYACNICGKVFSDRSNHAQTHEGGKRYKCGVCGKTFSSNNYRNRHHKEKHQ